MKSKNFLLVAASVMTAVLAAVFILKIASLSVYADHGGRHHKVILFSGSISTPVPGLDLWQDYGSFGLYRITDQALQGLPVGISEKLWVVDEMDTVLLGSQPFNTQRETPAVPAHLSTDSYEGEGLFLVQFVGPIKAAWLSLVESTGTDLIHYIANNAYLVWAGLEDMERLERLAQSGDFIQYLDIYQPFYKVGLTLRDRVADLEDSEATVHVVVQMYRHAGMSATQEMIRTLSAEQVARWRSILEYQNAEFVVRIGDIPAIANRPDVFWVGERLERELTDEVQGQILASNFDASMSGPSGPGYLAWLEGYGFSQNPADYPIVDISDDGIGNGTVASGDYTLHQSGNLANPTRLAYVHNCTSEATGEGVGGHGHINASIAGGYDAAAGFPYQDVDGYNRGLGINPYGRIGGTRIFGLYFDISNCGNSDTGLIKSIQDNGAQISSNSWGCGGCAGIYDDSSQAYDVGTRDADLQEPGNQEMIFVFAAGNDGPSSGSVGTPGNGKNIITAGASESDRPTWTDGCLIGPTGANNAMDVIGFSSRGPAPGGRAKPEVIAPGTHIQGTASTSSSYNGSSVCDQYQPAGQTIFASSSGTSHSTPAVSGVASLYYYWLENMYGLSPSPALMKAYLVAHPTYLSGVDAADTLPSNNQGYGMPNMELGLDNMPRYLVDQSQVFDNSGETWQFTGFTDEPSKPLRVVLAYTDKAGAVGTSPQVNDLNLAVEVGGNTYHGNHFSGQWSIPGGSPDPLNNTEAIFLPPGTSGPITIRVTGFNIADDGIPGVGDSTDQDFALVCYNCTENPGFTLDATPQTEAICVPEEGQYDVAVGQVMGFDDPVTLSVTGNPPGTTAGFSINPVVPPGDSELSIGNTAGVPFGTYSLDVVGVAPTSTHTVTVGLDVYTTPPGTAALVSPTDGALNLGLAPTLEWTEAVQANTYVLEVAQDLGFGSLVYSAAIDGTSHTIQMVLQPDTWYYWRVTAENACGSGNSSNEYAFKTLDAASILVVDDDDNNPDVRDFYTDTLDSMGVPYDVWDTISSGDEPDENKLLPYEAVVWFSGDDYFGIAGPSPDGEAALGSWLDHGNCLLLSSQDYYYDRGNTLTLFMINYLGVGGINGDSGTYDGIIGAGSPFDGLGPYSLSYPPPFDAYLDVLIPDETAGNAFIGINDQVAAIYKSSGVYKSVFMGFPFEGLSSLADRQEVLSRFLEWCSGGSSVFVPIVIR